MPLPFTVPTRDDVMTSHQSVEALDAQIAATEAAVAAVKVKADALAAREADHAQSKPAWPTDGDDALVASLVADPAGDLPGAQFLKAGSQVRAATDAWEKSAGLIRQARVLVDQEAAAAAAPIADLIEQREAAWVAFVLKANTYAVGAFATAFAAECAPLAEFLSDLAKIRDADGDYIVRGGSIARIEGDIRSPLKMSWNDSEEYRDVSYEHGEVVPIYRSRAVRREQAIFPAKLSGETGAAVEAFRAALREDVEAAQQLGIAGAADEGAGNA